MFANLAEVHTYLAAFQNPHETVPEIGTDVIAEFHGRQQPCCVVGWYTPLVIDPDLKCLTDRETEKLFYHANDNGHCLLRPAYLHDAVSHLILSRDELSVVRRIDLCSPIKDGRREPLTRQRYMFNHDARVNLFKQAKTIEELAGHLVEVLERFPDQWRPGAHNY